MAFATAPGQKSSRFGVFPSSSIVEGRRAKWIVRVGVRCLKVYVSTGAARAGRRTGRVSIREKEEGP